jgi:outer membrane protein TolC
VRNVTFNAFDSTSPKLKASPAAPPASGPSAQARQALAVTPSLFNILGPGQTDFPFSLTYATVPIYTGGRIKRGIEAARADSRARGADELRTALDLKLAVAEAYIGVLHARRDLETARSNVEQLASFLRDVSNRRVEGLAIRSDELAARVSLSNAQLAEIKARTALQSSWATYNRYLCRPLDTMVDLEELAIRTGGDGKEPAAEATRAIAAASTVDEGAIGDLTRRALASRPELAGQTEQARSLGALAEATRAAVHPQIGFAGAFVWTGGNLYSPQGIGAAAFFVDWAVLDGRGSRCRSDALHQQERATLLQRGGAADDIALEVRGAGSAFRRPTPASRSPAWPSNSRRRTSRSSSNATASRSANTPRSSMPRPAA